MKIAVVQPDTVWEDRPANFERIRALLDRDVPDRVDLIGLPEMFSTGFSMNLEKTAEAARGETLAFLKDLARERGCSVVGGFMEKGASDRGRNTLVAVSSTGEELFRYVKMHPFRHGGEDESYEKGDGVPVVPVAGFDLAPLICYDLRFPEAFREAMAGGANLYIVAANWPERRIEHFVALLRARAIENLAYVVGINRVGSGGGLDYCGRSVVFDPFGECRLDLSDREGAGVCELDVAHVRSIRSRFGFLDDARADRYPFLRRDRIEAAAGKVAGETSR